MVRLLVLRQETSPASEGHTEPETARAWVPRVYDAFVLRESTPFSNIV